MIAPPESLQERVGHRRPLCCAAAVAKPGPVTALSPAYLKGETMSFFRFFVLAFLSRENVIHSFQVNHFEPPVHVVTIFLCEARTSKTMQ